MEWYWTTLIALGIWFFLGLIGFFLGLFFLHEDGEKVKFWNVIFIIALGFLSLVWITEEIHDEYMEMLQ